LFKESKRLEVEMKIQQNTSIAREKKEAINLNRFAVRELTEPELISSF
jgi:hypothetical protein